MPGPSSHPHRMRDLVRLSGASAPTIHFYGQQGLLPAPMKTSENQALYSDDTLVRIAWIRTLQQDLRLSLRTIRLVLERWGELPADEVRALQTLGRLLEEPDRTATAEEIASGLVKLEPGDLDQMRAMELIPPAGVRLRSSDARLIELVGAMRSTGFTEAAGFSAANLGVYRDAVQQLVEEELSRFIEPVIHRNDPAALRDLIQRGLPLVHQLLALLHQRALQEESKRWLEEPEPVNTATA